jgi:hypothetical protein
MAAALLCELSIEICAVDVCAALLEVSECEILAVLLSAVAAVRFCPAFASKFLETLDDVKAVEPAESAVPAVDAPDQVPT